jgi:hypothetical protein
VSAVTDADVDRPPGVDAAIGRIGDRGSLVTDPCALVSGEAAPVKVTTPVGAF